MSRICSILLAALLLSGRARAEEAIDWQPWSDEVFERAQEENRFVLLDLGAVWCHWCHVMEDVTYRDPEVIRLLRSRYIAVRVDQDSRPDLSNRYEDYGWPATVVFDADKGMYKRHWFAYGEKAAGAAPPAYAPNDPPAKSFRDVTCIDIARDGQV